MLKNQIIKTLKISFFTQLSFGFIKQTKILLLKTHFNTIKYFLIPEGVHCTTDTTKLLLFLDSTNKKDIIKLEQFYNIIRLFLKNTENLVKKKLRLKGLGLKASLSVDRKFLDFKLGYSHLISLPIPRKNIHISLQKNIICIEGVDNNEVGNFASKIRSLRVPDSYKGKGFWYMDEKESLKEVKKK